MWQNAFKFCCQCPLAPLNPGSEELEALQTTGLLERDIGGEPNAALAALLLLGKKGQAAAAAEVLFRFKTEVKTGLMCHS
jgi:hypothetical protein